MDSESFGTMFGVEGRQRRGKDISVFSSSFNTIYIRCYVKWLTTLHLEIYVYNGPKSQFRTLCFYFFFPPSYTLTSRYTVIQTPRRLTKSATKTSLTSPSSAHRPFTLYSFLNQVLLHSPLLILFNSRMFLFAKAQA